SGALLCGDCKGMLIERVNGEFARHRAAREAAKAWMESTIVEHPPHGMDVRKAGAETPNRPVDS
ncbi:MAG: hypothetical protein L3J86_00355, partial [Thermoplasmata archaeon]|nr:hypothetical protein [Thermoplasmata archaeon]